MKVGIVLENLEIKCGKIIGTTQGTSRMTTLRAMDHSYDISSYL